MPVVIRKKPGDSNQQVLSEFRRETMFDEVLEKMKQRLMEGFVPPSELRKRERIIKKKEQARERRRAARLRGNLKR